MNKHLRSLKQIADKERTATVFLTPLDLSDTDAELVVKYLGMSEFRTTNTKPDRESLAIYRYLGIRKEFLNCDSTTLVTTTLQPQKEEIECNGDPVYSLKIPDGYNIPYVELTYGSSVLDEIEILGERRRLRISNHTIMDLWIEWFRDVHEDHHIDFIPHGKGKERKSRKVDVSASFPIKIYKNDAGNVGKYLGAFTANVTVYDHIELLVIEIKGKQYLQAVSLIELPTKVLLTVLL